MDRERLYLVTLALLNTIAVAVLAALSETRLDVYVSMFALIYFASTAIFRPRKRLFDVVGLSLLVVFSYVVAMRVLEVLVKP